MASFLKAALIGAVIGVVVLVVGWVAVATLVTKSGGYP